MIETAHWLLTWRTYGTWLPGDSRGFVSNVRSADGRVERHNIPGTERSRDMPGLERYALEQMKGEPICLTLAQAQSVADDLRDSAGYRGWRLLALAVIVNHIHVVVGAPEVVLSKRLLQVFKAYASRRLNGAFAKPPNGTWWATSGSRRRLIDDNAVEAAVKYVRTQPNPLVVWVNPTPDS